MGIDNDNFFFKPNSQIEGRSCRFFSHTSIENHLDVMKGAKVGKFLCDMATSKNIKFVPNSNLPESTEGRFVIDKKSPLNGRVEFGHLVNAMILGHELRHAWQWVNDVEKKVSPTSVEEDIFLKRALEADARAIDFCVTIQSALALHMEHEYATNLVACLDENQKRILGYSVSRLEEIAHSPSLLKQAMRHVFDDWIAEAPCYSTYEEKIESELRDRPNGSLLKLCRLAITGRTSRFLNFEKAGVRPDFVGNVAEMLGKLDPSNGNYLTETKGLNFTNEFYTRISNHRLEKLADPVRQRVMRRFLSGVHI